MTDRELLEMAAKAYGYRAVFNKADACQLWTDDKNSAYIQFWNPLTDDRDAFILAVDMELDVLRRVVGGKRIEVLAAGGPLIQEFYEGEPYSAARRAIVRAAAEVARKRATKEA